jgi:lauroyl/myristoyl acyltransferase
VNDAEKLDRAAHENAMARLKSLTSYLSDEQREKLVREGRSETYRSAHEAFEAGAAWDKNSREESHQSALAAIGHLREAGKKVLKDCHHELHGDSCHCAVCELAHAMSATSGYK